ncbi:hypothetical protein [Stenotrophomonas rhizophila]|uniref:hypothetical protein n=1 Tax=Stenotrophomonas rhizophila TaxID=216778 RepID=UPI0010C0F180|nr:hypothetical protein [Stenotrophomonas rhizophila]
MIITRAVRHERFEVVPSHLIRDKRLSILARGVAIRLLTNVDGYRMTADDLAADSPSEGRHRILGALKELRQVGYLVQEKKQDGRGRWSTTTTIYDSPHVSESMPPAAPSFPPTNQPEYENRTPVTEGRSPEAGQPTSGDSTLKSTNTNTNTISTTTSYELVWPRVLGPREVVVVAERFEKQGLPNSVRQEVLDELAGKMAGLAPPRQPMSWLFRVIDLAAAGQFVPDAGKALAKERVRRSREEAERQQRAVEVGRQAARSIDPEELARRRSVIAAAHARVYGT